MNLLSQPFRRKIKNNLRSILTSKLQNKDKFLFEIKSQFQSDNIQN